MICLIIADCLNKKLFEASYRVRMGPGNPGKPWKIFEALETLEKPWNCFMKPWKNLTELY